jgi:hypothetical protein
LDVNGDLTITDGNLKLDTNDPAVTIAGNVSIAALGTWTKQDNGASTTTFDGTTATTYEDLNATKQNLGLVAITKTNGTPANNKLTLKTSTGNGMKVDTLTISADNTLDLNTGGYTLELANAGATATVLTVNGTLTPGTSTVKYSATNSGGNVNVTTATYSSLKLSGAETYVLTGDLTSGNSLTGNLTIDNGAIIDGNSKTIAIISSGGFVMNGGTVSGLIWSLYTNFGNHCSSSGPHRHDRQWRSFLHCTYKNRHA